MPRVMFSEGNADINAYRGRWRLLFKKKKEKQTYDQQLKKPVIRASICTGEQVAGFRDLSSGRFEEIAFIRDKKDLAEFMEAYGIVEGEITREW